MTDIHDSPPPKGIDLTASLDRTTVVLPGWLVNVKKLLQRLAVAVVTAAVVLVLSQAFAAIGGVILLLSLMLTRRMITMPRTTLEIQTATLTVHQKGRESVRIPLEAVLQVRTAPQDVCLHTQGRDINLNTSLSPVQLQWLDQRLQAWANHRRAQLLEAGHVLGEDPVPAALKNLQDNIN